MRRRLRLPSSSDEDDGDRSPPSNPNPTSSVGGDHTLIISDDEFVDVPDAFSDPSPSPPASARSAGAHPDLGEALVGSGIDVDHPSVHPIDEFLRKLGLRLRHDWLASCTAGLESSGSGFDMFDIAGKAKLCFEQFLLSDMNFSGAGILPADVHVMHMAELEGPFVLQVDEVINISSSLRERYNDAPAGFKRCLKLSLTDGVQRVFGMEYRPIKELKVVAPAGFKVVIRNVQIRRGLLILVPEVMEILGGLAENLDAARERLVNEINKPPRGKRKQGALTLSKRASLAAWPSNTASNGVQSNVSMAQVPNYPAPTSQAPTLAATGNIVRETLVEPHAPHIRRNPTEERTGQYSSSGEFAATHVGGSIPEEFASARSGPYGNVNSAPSTISVGSTDRNYNRNICEEFADTNIQGNIADELPSVNNISDLEPNTIFGMASDMNNTHLSVDDAANEVEHPLILSGNKERPFTYLACLLEKWTTEKDTSPYIRGRIKCFLTGVKGFQFKQRSKFELYVYVDDGSLISELVIDHDVVQKGIGHSPEEVSAALTSSDKKVVADMRESMKRFQLFLAKFEGTVLVEMNGTSPLPVALEMIQGCSTSDAWLLFTRLKNSATHQNPQFNQFKPIDLSP